MKHLGDITKINWFEVDPVDCVTGGSPCQDLSVAGKRAGLAGERSGLYMEQIRCIKELRQNDVNNGRTGAMVRPRWMVWENVPGAFSSNGGKDFAAVLEEAVKIVEPQAPSIPVPDKGWPSAGCLSDVDGKWSVAWRVHDAQFWGVLQRRKRIALVCDFGGMSAPEVLFERQGLSRDSEQGRAEREEAARTAGSGIEGAISFQERAGCPGGGKGILIQNERTGALSTLNNQSVCYNIGSYHSNAWKSDNPHSGIYESEISKTLDALNCGAPTCNQGGTAVLSVYDARGNGNGEVAPTMTGDHQNRITDYTAIVSTYQEVTGPLMANSHPGSYCGQDAYSDMLVTQNVEVSGLDCRNARENGDLCGTLQSKPNGGFSYNCIHPVRVNQTVRRLTPLECERLQGYPDGWTDIGEWIDSKGKKHKEADSPRYKALGNSIALPFWFWLLRRISAQYERPATLGSLFDGISGFCLSWARCNGAKNCRWSSEIEEFPMAVTRKHFGDEKTGEVGDIEKYL